MPLVHRILILPPASRDLAEICTYIEQQSPQNAASVAQGLLDAIDSLDLLPRRFKVHQNRRDPALKVHAMPVPPFIVYYRVDEARQAVRVLSVRHGAGRQPLRFK